MIAEKMKPYVKNNSAIRMMFEEGNRLRAIYGADKVYDFSLGNPSVPAPECVKEAIIDLVNEVEPTVLHGYMSNAGFEDVRQTIAESLNRRFGTKFAAKNLIMTVGAASGLNVIFKTILNPEEEVIVFAPYFLEYGAYVRNFDGKLVEISPDTTTFQPNLGEFEQKITAKTRAVIVNTPHNPTGVVYSEETIKKLAAILEKKQQEFGSVIYLISDEPYRELVYDDKGRAVQSQADIVLVDNDGQLLVIDVRSSYLPDIKGRMLSGQRVNSMARESMIDQEKRQLMRTSQVLYDIFGSNIEGTYVMPFYSDRKANRMFAEPVFKVEMLDFNKPVTPYYNKSNEDISNEIVKPLQDKVNDLVSDLQSLYDSITEAGGEHKTVPSYDIFKEGSNKDELLLQIRDLHSAIESIQSLKEDAQMRLNQLLQPKQHENTVPEFYPEDTFDHVIVDEQYQAGLDTVHEICKKLDTLLSSITNLNITTADERTQVNELIYSIYDAQTALDQFYGSDQFKVGDTLPEQKLITAAINKLVSNRMMYGDAASKALQMWQTQFSSNIGNPSFTYFNKIKSFLATFDGEFMNSLVGNKSLQRFWSTVLVMQIIRLTQQRMFYRQVS